MSPRDPADLVNVAARAQPIYSMRQWGQADIVIAAAAHCDMLIAAAMTMSPWHRGLID